MNKKELYLNANSCCKLLNVALLVPFIKMLFNYEDVKSLYFELIDEESKSLHKYKISYQHENKISIQCSDGRELQISILSPSLQLINVIYKIDDYKYITYTLQINNSKENYKILTTSDISIYEISYKNYRFKDSFVPLEISGFNNEKVFNYTGLQINAYNLEPCYYSYRLPKYDELKSFSAQQEKIKLMKIVNDQSNGLNETTNDLIRGLYDTLDKREKDYKEVITIYNEWLKKLDEYKELIDILLVKTFKEDELKNISSKLDEKINDESAKRLIKSLASNMVEALKRQLNK